VDPAELVAGTANMPGGRVTGTANLLSGLVASSRRANPWVAADAVGVPRAAGRLT